MLSENTSSIGKPDISFTLNNDPDKLSVILNNSPCEPCTVNTGCDEPEPYTINEDPNIVPFKLEIYALDAVKFCVIETLPVTPKLPVIKAEPVNGNGDEAGAYEADKA